MEDEPNKGLHIRLPLSLKRAVKIAASMGDTSVQDWVADAITRKLKAEDQSANPATEAA